MRAADVASSMERFRLSQLRSVKVLSRTMSTPNTSQYLLLLRGTQLEKSLSPDDLQLAMERFTGWFQRLTQDGKIKGGQPLAPSGEVISRSLRPSGDGPFIESKEAVGGYVLVEVADFEEARQLANECPLLDYGSLVEVRPVLVQCPAMEEVSRRMASV